MAGFHGGIPLAVAHRGERELTDKPFTFPTEAEQIPHLLPTAPPAPAQTLQDSDEPGYTERLQNSLRVNPRSKWTSASKRQKMKKAGKRACLAKGCWL